MWAAREAEIACRLALARSVKVAANIVCRTPSEIEALLKLRGVSKRPWSDADRELLRFYMTRYEIETCAALLECTPEEAVAEAEKLGFLDLGFGATVLKKKSSPQCWNKWKDEDKAEALRMLEAKKPPGKIAKRFGRSREAVMELARKNGFSFRRHQAWTTEQDELLKKNLHLGWAKIGRLMGKSAQAVYERARHTNLITVKRRK